MTEAVVKYIIQLHYRLAGTPLHSLEEVQSAFARFQMFMQGGTVSCLGTAQAEGQTLYYLSDVVRFLSGRQVID